MKEPPISESTSGLIADIVRQLNSETLNFPVLPQVTRNIHASVRNPNLTIAELAQLVQTDPGLTQHLLGIVNSAGLRAFRKIRGCQDAVARLGLQSTRYHAYIYAVRSMYRKTPAGAEELMRRHSQFSTELAATASTLAGCCGLGTEEVLMGAMLQEVGVIPLIEWIGSNVKRFHIRNPQAMLATLAATQAKKIGVQILQEWEFEPTMIELVGERENWLRPGEKALQKADVINLSRIHVLGGITSKRKLPHITLLPAYQKLPRRELTEQRTLLCLQELGPEIRELQATLMGSEA